MKLPYEADRWRVDTADCVKWLSDFAPRSVDLICCDPAYESLEKHRAVGTTTRLTKDWFPIFRNERFREFFLQCWKVLKTHAHLYVMCDAETMFVIKPMAEQIGFKFWKPIVWVKDTIGMGYHYRAKYEFILFFEKGDRKLNDLGVADVLQYGRVRNGYPTQKPVELCRTLIRQSTELGELVIDPFCGSGSTGEAALEEGRLFLGCDVKEEAVELSRRRLTQVDGRLTRAEGRIPDDQPKAADGTRWICTEQRPMPKGAEGRWEHTQVDEVGEQEDGYPGGDLVRKECLICGETWKEELPQ